MTIITIIIACIILYKSGIIKRFLAAVTIQDATQETKKPPELSGRERLEMQARFIVKRQGIEPDTVKYMSNGYLQAIINDYIKENYQGGQK